MRIPFIRSRFTKIIQPNRFDYTPRYYDPQKEELDNLVKEAKARHGMQDDDELLTDDEKRALQLRVKFQERIQQSRSTNAFMSNSGRSIFILIAIIILGYFLFNNLDYILQVIM